MLFNHKYHTSILLPLGRLGGALCLLFLLLLPSCRPADDDDDAGHYTLTGTVEADTLTPVTTLRILTDGHGSSRVDTLLVSQGKFQLDGHARGLNELYLCCDEGELARFYAGPGMSLHLTLTAHEGQRTVAFDPADTLNAWLHDQCEALVELTPATAKARLDTLCRQQPSAIRSTLLLRDVLTHINDSIYVRRTLGTLTSEAKPEWLLTSFQHLLDGQYDGQVNRRRLARPVFQLADSTSFDVNANRSDYLLVCCWADYAPASLDSLKAVARRVANDYTDRRVQLLTLCLHAADSAAWLRHVEGLEGMHALVPGGFADKRMADWHVERVPQLLLFDMYTNFLPIKAREEGQDLLDAAMDLVTRRTTTDKPHKRPTPKLQRIS